MSRTEEPVAKNTGQHVSAPENIRGHGTGANTGQAGQSLYDMAERYLPGTVKGEMTMGKSRETKPRYRRCCVYDLEAEQLCRNLQLQEIKSYGDSVTLEDGTVLHKTEKDPDMYMETNERTLCRCRKCGALFLKNYHYKSDMYDSWSSESLYPAASEEEADLINILMDGKEAGLPDFRRIYRHGWSYEWIGKEDPRPLDTEELKTMIRRKYAPVNG